MARLVSVRDDEGFARLSERMSDAVEAERWRSRAESLRAKLDACAWDGGWYLRAFHDDGSLVGSAKARECSIDSIAQSWAVLSGAGDCQRARAAMRRRRRATRPRSRTGSCSFWTAVRHARSTTPGTFAPIRPAFARTVASTPTQRRGLASRTRRSATGGAPSESFACSTPFCARAPSKHRARYRVEPYALAGDVYGCPPWVGRGGWTWYTGAAAWMWRLGVDAILGLRKEDGHLRIDPCIPPQWKGFEAWVRLGERCIHVVVDNPDGVAGGVVRMTLNGAELDSNRIDSRSERDRHARGPRTTGCRRACGSGIRRAVMGLSTTAHQRNTRRTMQSNVELSGGSGST